MGISLHAQALPAPAETVSAIMGALRGCSSQSPAEILGYLNRVLHGQVSGFVTCCVALDAADGAMIHANAGNPAPYCNGREMVVASGIPLGLVAEVAYEETGFQLPLSSLLTFVSDGIVVARSTSGELFGFERTASISSSGAVAIAQAAQAFGQDDDITVLTITMEPSSAEVIPGGGRPNR